MSDRFVLSLEQTRVRRARAVLRRVTRLVAVPVVLAMSVTVLGAEPAPVTVFAAAPVVQLTKAMPTSVLYGANVPVTLSAKNTSGADGYNLSFSDTLPVGVTLANPSLAPTQQIVLGNGKTVVIWQNVSDLLAGTTSSVSYEMAYTTPAKLVGNVLTNSAGAYVNSDERTVPKFDQVTGVADNTSYNGSGTASASTTLVPFKVDKTEPSPEAELLRGIHDHKTVYTLTITNNSKLATTTPSIVDFLPAGLEFLGCTQVDNTTPGVEEYTGSGRIDNNFPTFANSCPAPFSVTTVTTDPDGVGPLPSAVYTRVEWRGIANLAPSAVFKLDYAAAIPLQENVAFAGNSTANLDNNTGNLTTDEEALTNYVAATGFSSGNSYTATTTHTVTAEDVAIQKSVDHTVLFHNDHSVWTMNIESSEYALDTGPIVVTDTIPDGLDYDPTPTSPAPDFVPTVNPDSTLHAVWTLPAFTGKNQTAVITLGTTARTTYRAGGPVSAEDGWENDVHLDTTSDVITSTAATTTNLPIIDDSSASQVAGGISIAKDVSVPSASMTCGDGSAITWNPTLAGPYKPGDRVCWRLTVNFPVALDTIAPSIRDFLPAGYTFESFAYGTANTISTGSVTFTTDTVTPKWDIPDAAPSSVFQIIVSSTITDATAGSTADIKANLMKVSYTNTAGARFQLRDDADATWVEPALTLDKSITKRNGSAITPVGSITAKGGDSLTFTITLANATTIPVVNTSVRDILPSGVDCGDISAISPAVTCDSGNNWIQWTGLNVAASGTTALTYDLALKTTYSPGRQLLNHAGVMTFDSTTNTGTPFTYTPANNIDPTLTVTNTTAADDIAQVTIASPTIGKSVTAPASQVGDSSTNKPTIGETATYTVTLTIPKGEKLYSSPTLTDVLDSRMAIVSNSATYTFDGGASTPATVAGQTISVTLPGTFTSNTSADDTIVLTYQATLTDVASATRSSIVHNTATFSWKDSGGTTSQANSNDAPLTIVEPNISIDKTSSADAGGGQVTPGQSVLYTLTVHNLGANASKANDVTIVDILPVDLIPQDGTNNPAADGATLPGGGVWNLTARTVTFTVATITPNVDAVLTYPTKIRNPVLSAGQITNHVTAKASSLPGNVTGERDASSPNGGAGSGYITQDLDTVTTPELTITKAASPTTVTIGDTITYTVQVTVPTGVKTFDATVLDTLPTNFVFDGPITSSCASTSGCSLSATLVGPTGSAVAFSIGDIVAVAEQRVVTIIYQGHVAAAANSGDALVNSATVDFNATDKLTDPPASVPPKAGFDHSSPPAVQTVNVVEPTLTIDKRVVGQIADLDTKRAKPGDVLTYTVAVTNTGPGVAYDVHIADTPDNRLTNFTSAPPGGVTATDTDPSDGTLAWTITSIAASATVTITYSLTIPAGLTETSEIVGGPELVNTVSVPSYLGVTPGSFDGTRDVVYGSGRHNVTPDVVSIELDLASIGDRVWNDINGDGVQDASEPALPGVTVFVRYAGADNTFGNADDETFTTTTDSSGNYLVNHLPGGKYRVSVTAGVPTGYTPSYDLDGIGTPNVWNGVLAENAAKRDVDFGYIGTGSIGDTVWFDQDHDGVKDANEVGLGGVGVTVVWAGPDGNLATTADNQTYTTTTSSTAGSVGHYLVGNLPPGNYSVAVNTASLPTGFTQVSDPDATLDSASTLTLAGGTSNLIQDFGYAGTGSIGDRLWLDVDGNGVQDASEKGIPNVGVDVTWAGPNGTFGDSDDETISTTTGANGIYNVDHLPPGSYRVAVSGALPAGVASTYDLDGTGTPSVATGTLTGGQNRTDFDFGYRATTVLGDLVWWDLNRDGIKTSNEPGIPGVTVTVTYLGTDGVAGGGDDIVTTTTTDANGGWTVTDFPLGNYVVAVTAGVPAGMSPTYDHDSGTTSPNGSSATTLTVGSPSDLLEDFGYAGTSSIGDFVWIDRNGDGVQGAGEPGIPNASVTITWFGPNGTIGGGDDVVFPLTTNTNGGYSLGGLPAGNYTVTVDPASLPVGLTPSFDRDLTADNTSTVALPAATAMTDVDFGYLGGAAIGDTIWFDRNGDGIRDAGEPGLGSVTVSLLWAGPDGDLTTSADNKTLTTTTAADGTYLFSGIPDGKYRVTVGAGVPPAMHNTHDEDGDDNGVTDITLAVNEIHLTADFGYTGDGSIGDTIWFDPNHDGVQQSGEPGIPGQTVQLVWGGPDGNLSTTSDNQTFTTTTDANGMYLFDHLPDGAFRVVVAGGIALAANNTFDPDGGTADQADVTLSGSPHRTDIDFGYTGANSVGDTVWWDVNGDGIDGGAGTEPRLAGVTLNVTWFGPDGVVGGGDDIVLPAVTASDGTYLRSALPDGTYSVTVTGGVLSGLSPSVDADSGIVNPDGKSVVTLTGGVSNLNQDFGYVGTGSIGETVWLDLDGNGAQSAGEPGIPAVTVTLTWAGLDGVFGTPDDTVTTTTTDAAGHYGFTKLPAGNFRVAVSNLPPGALPSGDPDGGNDLHSVLALAAGGTNLAQDFGFTGTGGVGDTVWLDLDGNATQGPGEPALPSIPVSVKTAGVDGLLGTGDDITITVTTDAAGHYLVVGLPVGPTLVSYPTASLPTGLTASSDRDGGNFASTAVTIVTGPPVLDVDFGVRGTATLSGTIFNDHDGNGTRDPGDGGVPGVTIIVVWNGPLGPVTITTTTGPDGSWSLPALPAGTYVVTVDVASLPPGTTLAHPGPQTVTLPAGGSAVLSDAIVATVSIGDTVWFDTNRNGVREAGEAGVPGIGVSLVNDSGVVVATTTTDGNGMYLFAGVLPGTYVVALGAATISPDLLAVYDPDGTLDLKTTVSASPGAMIVTADFGFVSKSSLPGTGTDSMSSVMIALSLLLLGCGALAVSRRRRRLF